MDFNAISGGLFLSQLIYGSDEDDNDNDNDNGDSGTNDDFASLARIKEVESSQTASLETSYQQNPKEDDNHGVLALNGNEPTQKTRKSSVDTSEAITMSLNALYTPSSMNDTGFGKWQNPLIQSRYPRTEHSRPVKSPQEQERRELCRKRAAVRSDIRNRWKTRRINLLDEEDVGNVLANQSRKWMKRKKDSSPLNEDEKQNVLVEADISQNRSHLANIQKLSGKKRARSRLLPKKIEKNEEEHIMDSSDEEQNQIIENFSLSQTMTQTGTNNANSEGLKKRSKGALIVEDKLKDSRVLQFENMSYWELGMAAPRKIGTKLWGVPKSSNASRLGRRTPSAFLNPSDSNMNAQIESSTIPDHYNKFLQFPLNNAVSLGADFLHYKQLVRLATRFIIGTAGKMRQSGLLEDRFLRELWIPTDREQSRRLFSLLLQTQQLGVNMETFLSYSWKDMSSRRLAIERLGLTDTRDHIQLLGPRQMVGHSLDANQVTTIYSQERRRLVAMFSDGRNIVKGSPEGQQLCSNIEEAEDERIWEDDLIKDQTGSPSLNYIHIPGTIPPIPPFPLNDAGFVFGPPDKHISFRQTGSVDEASYKLTLSSLLSRISVLSTGASNDTDHRHYIEGLEEQLCSLLEMSPSNACNSIEKFPRKEEASSVAEIALVQYYRALMSFCSFCASGLPGPWRPETMKSNSDDNQDPSWTDRLLESDETMSTKISTMNDVAKKIFDFATTHIQHSGLQSFPSLHITFGLVALARRLPPSAADILSRPLDDWQYRTPFDIFRSLLEHLEEEGMLIESGDMSRAALTGASSLVEVAELEHALHEAASIFRTAVEKNPVEINYHAWYLGALTASLVLCSGNRIGSFSFPFPSSSYSDPLDSYRNQIFGLHVNEKFQLENPRKTLAEFNDMRKRVQGALKTCIHLCQYQKASTRGHLTLSSFLEWKQAIALIAGRSCQRAWRLREIRGAHHYHSVQWALLDRSPDAAEFLKRLGENLHRDRKLLLLAADIEDDPDRIENWRALSNALGPVGVQVSEEARKQCNEVDCKECKMLKKGLNIAHEDVEIRKSSGQWWGCGLVSWWYSHYLSMPGTAETATLPISEEKLEKLIKALKDSLESDSSPNVPQQTVEPSCYDISWLWDENDDNDSDAENKTSGLESPDDILPCSFVQVMEPHRERDVQAHCPRTTSVAERTYLKLVVTCHLYGMNAPGLSESVFELARKSIGRNWSLTSCEELHYLQKLSKMGLDVPCFLQDYYSHLGPKTRRRAK